MTLTTDRFQQKLTLAQFVERLPDREGRYELVNGEIMRILATVDVRSICVDRGIDLDSRLPVRRRSRL
jgi:hypothetical protein